MKEQIKRLVKWSRGQKQGPFSIEIHPTNLCNLNCIMCGTQIEHKRLMKEDPDFNPLKYVPFELKTEKMIQIVIQGKRLGVKKWLITGGGEPFVRKEDTLAVMRSIKEFDMYGNINTNGVLLNKEDIQRIIDMKWDMVMFSVDSHIPEIHDFMRGKKGTFSKVKKVLDLFKQLKNQTQSNKPKVVFNTVLCNKNFNRLDEFIRFAHTVDCKDITFIPLIQFNSEIKVLALNDKEKKQFQKEISKIDKISQKYNIHTNIKSLEEKDESCKESIDNKNFSEITCFEPFLNLVIRMDGKYSPCCMIDNYDDTIINKSLSKVWFGKYFSNIRKKIINNKIPQSCLYCVHTQMIQNKKLREELRKKTK